MKVGRIILMTAIMLAWPVLAMAGVDPCPGDTDLDGDGVCDAVDNCPPGVNHPAGVPNPAQLDGDGDGRGNECDNCTSLQNGPTAFAAGYNVSQCDRDSDGFGNACDSDINQDGFATALDTPPFLAALMSFIPTPPAIADINCDGFHTALDTPRYLSELMSFTNGPSGWACAPGPGGPIVVGSCPPLP